MTEHIREIASAPETAETEEKKNGITEGKKKGAHSHPHYSRNWKEFETGKTSGFTTEITLTGIFRFIYNSNPFYLISAAIILYAQSVLFGTSDIALPTLIPVGLIASYTLLLAATAVFIVQWGHVWDDAPLHSPDHTAPPDHTVGQHGQPDARRADSGTEMVRRRTVLLRSGSRKPEAHPQNPPGASISCRSIFHAGSFFLYPVLNARLIAMYPDDRLPSVLAILFFPVAAAPLCSVFSRICIRKTFPKAARRGRLRIFRGALWRCSERVRFSALIC